uniref:Ankyrin repeat and SOCS box containing 16 n=1 Tax=Oryctolagus cuniculus TaxID=9986 RepID=A0A5F9C9L7_RABIT
MTLGKLFTRPAKGLFIASAAPLWDSQERGEGGSQSKGGRPGCLCPTPGPPAMAGESFPFTPSTLRALRLQREWLEWEDRRRAAAQRCRSHRRPSSPRARLTRPRRSCRDPAVHSVLFSGDLQQVQALFHDEEAANMIVETASNQLAWSSEQGFWVLAPKTKQTAPLTIAAARGYTDCARHLILQGAELDARVGGRAALHEACARAQLDCVRLLLNFGPRVLTVRQAAAGGRSHREPGGAGDRDDAPARGRGAGPGEARGSLPGAWRLRGPAHQPGGDGAERRVRQRRGPGQQQAARGRRTAPPGGRGGPQGGRAQAAHAPAQRLCQRLRGPGRAAAASRGLRESPQRRGPHTHGLRAAGRPGCAQLGTRGPLRGAAGLRGPACAPRGTRGGPGKGGSYQVGQSATGRALPLGKPAVRETHSHL